MIRFNNRFFFEIQNDLYRLKIVDMNDSIKTILYIIFYFGVGILLGYIIGEFFS